MAHIRHIRGGLAASALVLGAAGGAAAQSGATEVWMLEGFAAPESAVYDAARGVIYVSNVAGDPSDKNGQGHISRVSLEGEMLEADWVTGLDAPKGLVLDGDTLYVTDIDRLVAIDVEAGEVADTWEGEGAEFLNDPAVDGEGRVYASDMMLNAIYRLDGDTFSVWIEDEALQHPNGLRVDGDRMIVAAWGQDIQEDFTTRVGGHLLTVDLETQEIAPLGSGEPIGNLDGVEPDGSGAWLVTDWIAGGLLRIAEDGSWEELVDLDQGSADLGYIEEERLVIVPMMLNDQVIAFLLE